LYQCTVLFYLTSSLRRFHLCWDGSTRVETGSPVSYTVGRTKSALSDRKSSSNISLPTFPTFLLQGNISNGNFLLMKFPIIEYCSNSYLDFIFNLSRLLFAEFYVAKGRSFLWLLAYSVPPFYSWIFFHRFYIFAGIPCLSSL
jgi:hypothetical protein